MIMNKRLVTLILTVLVSISVLYFGYIFFTRYGKTAVTILTSPDLAEISFGENRKITGSQTLYLSPGNYSFHATRPEFSSETVTTTVTKEPTKLVFVLTPLTERARKEAEQSSYLAEIDKAMADSLSKEQAGLEKKNPVIKKLPISNLIYSIGYKADNSRENGVIIEIQTSPGYRNSTLSVLKNNGFDPTQLNINFKDYDNPFME